MRGLTFLLDHLPPNKHIVITTRSDPALPLHRYRSRGQLVEIRADDLRFSRQEIASYMEEAAGAQLKATEIETLEKRTEGWAAGLQMAAISMRGKADPGQFIQSLAGTNRYILDYLLEEVLNNQPVEVQDFLVETSILDRLCPPLCGVLLHVEEGKAQRLLQYLEHENLFISPLDDERYWYRYHHLFRDLLEMRLRHTAPEKMDALHLRAAEWLVTAGEIDQAVHHFIQGKDFDRAAELVEQHALRAVRIRETGSAPGLDAKASKGALCQAALAEHLPGLDAGLCREKHGGRSTHSGGSASYGANSTSSLEVRKRSGLRFTEFGALVAITSGNLQGALDLHQLLDTEIPSESLFARSVVLWGAGYAWRMQGQLAKAREAFRRSVGNRKKAQQPMDDDHGVR